MIVVEIRKLVRRPRTWVSVALLCLLPTIVAIFLAISKIAPRPGEGPSFLSAVLSNGQLYPAAALGIVLPIFLPVSVAVVAGDSIAGEASTGTLRYLLVRAVGRTRLLVAKLAAVIVYTVLAVVAVAVTGVRGRRPALRQQLARRGDDDRLGHAPDDRAAAGAHGADGRLHRLVDARRRGGVAVPLDVHRLLPRGPRSGVSRCSSAAPVLVTLDAAGSVRDWLPTRYWLAWVDLFREPILWHDIERGILVQGAYIVVLLGAAWANFATRDITS